MFGLREREVLIPVVSGQCLTSIGAELGIYRRWYEKIWLMGDLFFRRRALREALDKANWKLREIWF